MNLLSIIPLRGAVAACWILNFQTNAKDIKFSKNHDNFTGERKKMSLQKSRKAFTWVRHLRRFRTWVRHRMVHGRSAISATTLIVIHAFFIADLTPTLSSSITSRRMIPPIKFHTDDAIIQCCAMQKGNRIQRALVVEVSGKK